MLGELTLGHTYIGGGEMPEPKRVKVGLLGADYRIENGRYRFARIFSGENWNPKLRAPLTQPGVNVTAGEPGDESINLHLGTGSGNDGSIPITLRSLIQTGDGRGSFSRMLTGGGTTGNAGQSFTYQ